MLFRKTRLTPPFTNTSELVGPTRQAAYPGRVGHGEHKKSGLQSVKSVVTNIIPHWATGTKVPTRKAKKAWGGARLLLAVRDWQEGYDGAVPDPGDLESESALSTHA